MENQGYASTSDERVMAGLSHLFGVIVALIIWATQKDKSKYVRFQALQAVAYSIVISILWFMIMGCFFVVMFLGMFGVMAVAVADPDAAEWMIMIPGMMPFMFFLIFPLALLMRVPPLIASISNFMGKDFHYPWLGNWVERNIR